MHSQIIQPSFEYNTHILPLADEGCHLCVEFSSNSLTVLVFNDNKKPILFEVFKINERMDGNILEQIFQNERYKNFCFSDVYLVVNNEKNSLIPDRYFNEPSVTAIYTAMHGDAEDVHIAYDRVHQWELTNVYGMNKFLYQFMMEQFPQTNVFHYVSVGLSSVLKNNLEDLDAFMKLYFIPNCVTVILVKGAQLQFAQSLYYETAEDAIYQILNLIEKHQMDITSVKTVISGQIHENSFICNELWKYISDIEFEDSLIEPIVTSENISVSQLFPFSHLHVLQCV